MWFRLIYIGGEKGRIKLDDRVYLVGLMFIYRE